MSTDPRTVLVAGVLRPNYFNRWPMLDVTVRERTTQPRRRWIYSAGDPIRIDVEILDVLTEEQP